MHARKRTHTHIHTHTAPLQPQQAYHLEEFGRGRFNCTGFPSDPTNTATASKTRSVSPLFMPLPAAEAAAAPFISLGGAAAPPPPPPPHSGGLVTEVASPFCSPFMARAQLPPKRQSQGQQQRQQQGEREQDQLSHPQDQLSQQGHQLSHPQGQLSQQGSQPIHQQGDQLWPVSEEGGGGGEGREDLSGRCGAMWCTQRSRDTVCCVRGC